MSWCRNLGSLWKIWKSLNQIWNIFPTHLTQTREPCRFGPPGPRSSVLARLRVPAEALRHLQLRQGTAPCRGLRWKDLKGQMHWVYRDTYIYIYIIIHICCTYAYAFLSYICGSFVSSPWTVPLGMLKCGARTSPSSSVCCAAGLWRHGCVAEGVGQTQVMNDRLTDENIIESYWIMKVTIESKWIRDVNETSRNLPPNQQFKTVDIPDSAGCWLLLFYELQFCCCPGLCRYDGALETAQSSSRFHCWCQKGSFRTPVNTSEHQWTPWEKRAGQDVFLSYRGWFMGIV